MTTKKDALAALLEEIPDFRRLLADCFITDGRCSVDGLDAIAHSIERAKGLEFLAVETRAGLDGVAAALKDIAAAMREGRAS